MKDSTSIAEHVNNMIIQAINRPSGYSTSSRELENILIILDHIYQFIVDGRGHAYAEYLVSQGYDAGGFVYGRDVDVKEITDFWKAYLAVHNRYSAAE